MYASSWSIMHFLVLFILTPFIFEVEEEKLEIKKVQMLDLFICVTAPLHPSHVRPHTRSWVADDSGPAHPWST